MSDDVADDTIEAERRIEAAIAAGTDLPAVAAAVDHDRLVRLAGQLARMPGGRYVGERWLTEPLTFVAVDAEQPGFTARLILGAYGHLPTGCDPDRDCRGRFVVAVPTTVGEMLEWYADEYDHWAYPTAYAPLGPDAAAALTVPATARDTARVATRLLDAAGLDDLDLDADTAVLCQAAAELVAALGAGVDTALDVAAAVDGDLLTDALRQGTLALTLLELLATGGSLGTTGR